MAKGHKQANQTSSDDCGPIGPSKEAESPVDSLDSLGHGVAGAAFLTMLAERIDDVLWVLNLPDLRFAYISPSVTKLTGYTPEEVRALDVAALFRPRDYERVLKEIAEAVARGNATGVQETSKAIELEQLHKDGTPVWVELSASMLRDSKGQPKAIVGVTHNIAERKLAERALFESEERLRTAGRAAYDLIYEWTVGSDALVWFGDIDKLLGYQQGEISRDIAAWLALVHPDDMGTLENAVELHRTSTEPIQYDYRVKHKNGTYRHWHDHGLPMLHNGRPYKWVGVCTDITEREKLKWRLLRSQKLESVGRLAGGVAHDFNNILTVINSYADFALEMAGGNVQLRADIEQILEAAQRATSLTSQLLAFSRRQILEPSVLCLNQVIGAMEQMLRRLIGENIQMRMVFATDLANVSADRSQIEQVVMNLVINARDAMPDGGELTVETANIVIEPDDPDKSVDLQPGRYSKISFEDTGIGMDKGALGNVFDPFYTTKEPAKGTGLGLSTVYGIVRQSGGHIKVCSELNKGTSFEIFLPSSDSTESPVEEPSQAQAVATLERRTETVLVVEDEDAVRRLTARILQQQGYTTLQARDGREAQAVAQRHRGDIQLLLTDVVMPGISGRELAEKLRAVRPDTKVLYMSGYTDNAIVHHGVLEPETAFIAKPFSPYNLLKKVQLVLDS